MTRWDQNEDGVERLRAAAFNAVADPDLRTTRQAPYLKGIESLPVSAYRKISEYEVYAARLGNSELR